MGDAPAEKYNLNILNIFHSHGWENVVFLVEKNGACTVFSITSGKFWGGLKRG